MNGTFQFYAHLFTKMFTIHGFKNGQCIPLVFELLPDEEYDIYVLFI